VDNFSGTQSEHNDTRSSVTYSEGRTDGRTDETRNLKNHF